MAIQQLYTLEEVAPMLRVSVRTLRRYINDGKLSTVRHSERGRIYISAAEVRTYIKNMANASAVGAYRSSLLAEMSQ